MWDKEQRVVLGVSDKEFSLLEVLNREGSLNTSALAYHASLPRVTTMRILKTLKERGFVARKTQSREVVWSIVDPRLLEKRLVNMFGDVHDSQKITHPSEVGSLTIYRGEKEMLESNERMLAAHPGERILSINPNGIWKHFEGASLEAWEDLNALFKKKNILIEIVLEEGFEQHMVVLGPSLIKSFFSLGIDIRVVKAGFLDSATEILMFRDQILFTDWAHLVAVEIKNPSTVRVMKAMYRLLQESGRKTK